MSASFGSSTKKGKTNQQQDPWEPTIPYLTNYLQGVGEFGAATPPGATPGQTEAFNNLSNFYGQGNPYADQISNLANETATGVPSQAGIVTDAYDTTKSALLPYANGSMLDFKNNPYIQDMLTQVGTDAANRENSRFAGAGRDLSAMNSRATASGVTSATTPILAQLYNQGQDRQMLAANQLQAAGNQTATTAQGLDQAALTGRAAAIPMFDQALASQSWGPENQFNLEQIFKNLPATDLATMGSLLFPAAQLGQQQQGTSKESGTSFGFGAKLLSDERLKENLTKVGMLADGTPIYSFNYKGEDTTRIGVSAQDMEHINPDAVTEYDTGNGQSVKYVDYGKATERSAGLLNQDQGMPKTAEEMGAATRSIAGPQAPSPLAEQPSGPPPGQPGPAGGPEGLAGMPPGMPGAPGGGGPAAGLLAQLQMAGLPPKMAGGPPAPGGQPMIPGRPGTGPLLPEQMMRYAA